MTGIVCTLGPACDSPAMLKDMAAAGMDVARLNFSHGNHREHKRRLDATRKLSGPSGRRIRVLQDLEGYRIRVGRLKQPVALRKGQTVFLINEDIEGKGNLIPFDYQGRLSDINGMIYIDDGNIVLAVLGEAKGGLKTEVAVPGILKERKGINIPGARLKFEGLLDKDKRDLEFGIREQVDFIAQSFVRKKEDILAVRAHIGRRLPRAKIIAKIENREGILNIDGILSVSDGIMVARGDMGVSIPIYQIPIVQKNLIRKCNRAGKPVITATQMLESMTENLRPTRAEVTDVANAILDGSDYVMLSGETAAGRHPVETVRMMNDVIRYTERHAPSLK